MPLAIRERGEMVKRIGVQVDAANRGHRVVVVRAEMKREALFRRDETFEILDEDSTDAPISAVFAHHERVQLPYAIVVVYAADLAEGLAVLDSDARDAPGFQRRFDFNDRIVKRWPCIGPVLAKSSDKKCSNRVYEKRFGSDVFDCDGGAHYRHPRAVISCETKATALARR